MIEVELEDVVVRVTTDDAPDPNREELRVVLLREREGQRLLPIWIGRFEGDVLALQLAGQATPRPVMADLMARLLEVTGARVDRVGISAPRDKTFYATISTRVGGKLQEIGARPSDALNLAARIGAAIFVEENVMTEAALARVTSRASCATGEVPWQRERPSSG